MQEVFIREMTEEDILKIYETMNKKYVEKYCENKNEIEEQFHIYEKWYKQILNSINFKMYIISNKKNDFLGNVKFEINKNRASVNIYICESIRGQNISYYALDESMKKIIKLYEITYFDAYILKENIRSINVFIKLGFEFKKNINIEGIRYMLYSKKNNLL